MVLYQHAKRGVSSVVCACTEISLHMRRGRVCSGSGHRVPQGQLGAARIAESRARMLVSSHCSVSGIGVVTSPTDLVVVDESRPRLQALYGCLCQAHHLILRVPTPLILCARNLENAAA